MVTQSTTHRRQLAATVKRKNETRITASRYEGWQIASPAYEVFSAILPSLVELCSEKSFITSCHRIQTREVSLAYVAMIVVALSVWIIRVSEKSRSTSNPSQGVCR
jgi:hypothetical protein